jgi:hypothetical protein
MGRSPNFHISMFRFGVGREKVDVELSTEMYASGEI